MATALSKGAPANGGLSTKTAPEMDAETLFSLVTNGDCSKLKPEQKIAYYKARCEAAGLDPRAQPFQYVRLQNKEILYATKSCTEQLAAKHGIVCEVIEQKTEAGVRTVTVRSRTKDGRQTDEIGCVSVQGLQGDALCNAFMKAVTKAKRRAVLSLCGLGMIDETEVETIPGVIPAVIVDQVKQEPKFHSKELQKAYEEAKPTLEAHAAKVASSSAWRGLLFHVECPKQGLFKIVGSDTTTFACTVPEQAAIARTAEGQKTQVEIKYHKNSKGVFIMDSITPLTPAEVEAEEEVSNG